MCVVPFFYRLMTVVFTILLCIKSFVSDWFCTNALFINVFGYYLNFRLLKPGTFFMHLALRVCYSECPTYSLVSNILPSVKLFNWTIMNFARCYSMSVVLFNHLITVLFAILIYITFFLFKRISVRMRCLLICSFIIRIYVFLNLEIFLSIYRCNYLTVYLTILNAEVVN